MSHDARSKVTRILNSSLAPGSIPPEELGPSECEELWVSARDHCLVPYLHQRWTDTGFLAGLPAEFTGRLAAARYRNAERNQRLLFTLDELRVALQQKGVPVLVSKGLPLAQGYYGDLGLRVMYDLDLIIRPADRTTADRVLDAMGYVPFFRHRHGQHALLWKPRDFDWDAEKVFDPEAPCFVELHTRPLESRWHGFRLEGRLDLWEGCRVQMTAGVPVRVPQAERLLVHLATHYACNVLESNARLMHLLDIVLLLRTRGSALDWDSILEMIRECHSAPFCFIALELARRTGGCFVPNVIRTALREATPSRIVTWLEYQGTEKVASMNLRRRERKLIYFLHWHMAAGFLEKSSMLAYAFRSPWREATGPVRLRSVIRRMSERLHYLALGGRTEGGA